MSSSVYTEYTHDPRRFKFYFCVPQGIEKIAEGCQSQSQPGTGPSCRSPPDPQTDSRVMRLLADLRMRRTLPIRGGLHGLEARAGRRRWRGACRDTATRPRHMDALHRDSPGSDRTADSTHRRLRSLPVRASRCHHPIVGEVRALSLHHVRKREKQRASAARFLCCDHAAI